MTPDIIKTKMIVTTVPTGGPDNRVWHVVTRSFMGTWTGPSECMTYCGRVIHRVSHNAWTSGPNGGHVCTTCILHFFMGFGEVN